MRLPAPIDSLSRISLRTVAVACFHSQAPLSILYLFLLAVEQSRRWLVTCCVDRVAATSSCVVGCRCCLFRRCCLAGHLRSRASSILSFLRCTRRRALFACFVPRVKTAAVGALLVEVEWMSLLLSLLTLVPRCLVLPAGSGLCCGGTVYAFSSPTLLYYPHSSLVSGFTYSIGKSTILPSHSHVVCFYSSR